jgi:hypothetical protein
MVYVGLGIAALLGLTAGISLGWRAHKTSVKEHLSRYGSDIAEDLAAFLYTLRRELANYMVRRDPERFLHLYREARAAEVKIGKEHKKSQQAQHRAITQKRRFIRESISWACASMCC